MAQHLQQEMDSSSSSRSSSPGLHADGLLSSELAQQRPADAHAQQQEEGSGSEGADAPRPPITYLLIYENELVSLGIFCLPARAKIPLHNHPGMTVLSRCALLLRRQAAVHWLQRRAEGAAAAAALPALPAAAARCLQIPSCRAHLRAAQPSAHHTTPTHATLQSAVRRHAYYLL